MSYAEHEAQTEYAAYRSQWGRLRSRRLSLLAAVLLVVFALGVVVVLVRSGFFGSEAPPERPKDELSVSFGFRRSPVTRSFSVDVSPVPSTSPTTAEADAPVLVRLTGDLRRQGGGGEFPADQVTAGIARLSATRLNLTATVNPWSPEKVHPGLYEGILEVRGGGVVEEVNMSIWLRNRENRWVVLALALLVMGSSLGLLVKWITERLTPQAAMYRRLSALREAINYEQGSDLLPISIGLDIRRLEELIAREDYAEAEALFKSLESQTEWLASLQNRLRMLDSQLSVQSRRIRDSSVLSDSDVALLRAVVDSEWRALQDIRNTTTEEGISRSDILGRISKRQTDFSHVDRVMSEFLARPSRRLREQLKHFQAGSFEPVAIEPIESSDVAGDDEIEDRAKQSRGYSMALRGMDPFLARPHSRGEERLKWLYRSSRGLAAIASIVVVSLVGLKLQYLDDQSFDGAMSAWLGLGLWAFVVELSGVSVLDVVGRLGTGGGGAPVRGGG